MDQGDIDELLRGALAHHQAGRADEAEHGYRRVLAISPHDADALHLLGMLEAGRGRSEKGLALLRRAIAVAPDFAELHRHLGEVQRITGLKTDALKSFARAVELDPNDDAARSCAGALLAEMRQLQQAAEQFRAVAERRPDDPLAQGNWGHILTRMGRQHEATAILKRAVDGEPAAGPLWLQYAEALWRSERYSEAVESAQRAVKLLPDSDQAWNMLGNALQTAGRLQEAEVAYQRSIELNASNVDAISNRATTLLKMGEAKLALNIFDKIMERLPARHDARLNRSLALLTLGDLEQGFAGYESRWFNPQFQGQDQPGDRWDGVADVRGKIVLLTREQGYGDTIQFIRYASLIADRGATVVVFCPVELAEVVRTVRGVSRVPVSDQESVTFDFYVPLSSLPRLLRTTLATVPADVPYVRASEERVAKWRQRLANDANLKVGITWAGNPKQQMNSVRSAKFADFAPLLEVEGVTFYSLQKGPAEADLNDHRVTPLARELNDFSDTAALLEALDLLISVDTSVVRLAGALARPVWTVLARGSAWQWMLDREDYPTMRLFRQTTPHDWPGVIQHVADELRTFREKW